MAIFRSELLPISETFIRDQARALKTWEPILLGYKEVPNGLQTSDLQRVIIPDTSNTVLSSLRFWLSRPNPTAVHQLKQLNVSVVHTHFGTDATDIWPSVRATGLPLLVTLHGYDINIHREWWEAGHAGIRRRVYPKRLLKMAEDPSVHFIAVSKTIQNRAIEYGIPEKKIIVSYIGVDTHRFKLGGLPLAQRRKRVLFVGRFVEKKAPLQMIQAFFEVNRQIPDAELVMIGDGPLRKPAEQLAQACSGSITFLGAQTPEQVISQLHQAKVFCLPSVTTANGDAEGLPISIIEAQACGIPVVTSQHGGNIEGIQPGLSGTATPEGDTSSLAHAITKLLTDDNLLSKASTAAIKFAQDHFRIDINQLGIVSAYEKASNQQYGTKK